jgi:hypothetical protein
LRYLIFKSQVLDQIARPKNNIVNKMDKQNDEQSPEGIPDTETEAPKENLEEPEFEETKNEEDAQLVNQPKSPQTQTEKNGSTDSTESEPLINVIQKVDTRPRMIRFLRYKNCILFLCSMVEFLFVFSYISLIQILPDET